MEARPAREPGPHFRVLVGCVVVEHQMDIERGGDISLDVAQEREELLVAVAMLAFGHDRAGGDVQGGEQRRGAVADVVVGHPFNVAQPHGQHRLCAVQRLHLAFLIDAEHQCLIRRVEIQPHNVPDLLGEIRIRRELEVALAMRLDTKRRPHALHGHMRDTDGVGHAPRAPVRGVGRLLLQRLVDQRHHTLIADLARASRAAGIVQPLDASLDEPPPPLPHSGPRNAKTCRHRLVAHPFSAGEHQLCPLDDAERVAARARQLRELLAFQRRELHRRLRSSTCHRCNAS